MATVRVHRVPLLGAHPFARRGTAVMRRHVTTKKRKDEEAERERIITRRQEESKELYDALGRSARDASGMADTLAMLSAAVVTSLSREERRDRLADVRDEQQMAQDDGDSDLVAGIKATRKRILRDSRLSYSAVSTSTLSGAHPACTRR